MIAHLQGTILSRDMQTVVLHVQGVGYELFVSEQTARGLGGVGDECALFTELVVREDSMTLFGFLSSEERMVFRKLIGVSGIGPKGALAVLSQGDPAALAHAVLTEQVTYFTAASGIGKKTAQRLLVELQGVVEQFGSVLHTDVEGSEVLIQKTDAHADAIAALQQLGYSEREAERAVHAVVIADGTVTTEVLVRGALKELSGATV